MKRIQIVAIGIALVSGYFVYQSLHSSNVLSRYSPLRFPFLAPVPFQHGILSTSEQQSIRDLYPGFARSSVIYSALWVRGGIVRHVCLINDFGGLTTPCDVFVFDKDGLIVEANRIIGPGDGRPDSLANIYPLQVVFARRGPDGGPSVAVGVAYSFEEGRRKIAESSRMILKKNELFDTWKRSGSTNIDTLIQMIRNERTNSVK